MQRALRLLTQSLLSFLVFAVLISGRALAQVPYGVYVLEDAQLSIGPPGHVVNYQKEFQTNGVLPKVFYFAPEIGALRKLKYSDGNFVYHALAKTHVPFAGVDRNRLVVWGLESGKNDDPNGNASATASASVIWQDTLIVGGLAQGTPVSVKVTAYLNSILMATGDFYAPACGITQNVSVTAVHLQNQSLCTNPKNQLLHVSQVLNTTSGAKVLLEHGLYVNTSGGKSGVTAFNVSADGCCSTLKLKVLTSGATITSLSGLDYSK